MKISRLYLPEVMLIEPDVHKDTRGHFLEIFQQQHFDKTLGPLEWTQDNVSCSEKGTVRGLHFQWPKPQGKLVTVMSGKIFDVAVDIRVGSPSFGQWVGQILDDRLHQQLWIPSGFAHGFQSLENTTVVHYKCAENFWSPNYEQTIRFNDPSIGISWPLEVTKVHDRDRCAPTLETMDILPTYNKKSSHA